jgi:hypothetical protein
MADRDNKLTNKQVIHELPAAGTSGQILTKVDDIDYNVEWKSAGVPVGGDTGEVLTKTGDGDYELGWGAGGGGGSSPFLRDSGDSTVKQDTSVSTPSSDNFLFGSTSMDYTDQANRMFFNKSKGAFRAGVASSTHWNDGNVGNYSFAVGGSTIASADYSHAEGYNNTASGINSHAEGSGSGASGTSSHAEGSAKANGWDSHAEGTNTTSGGIASHSEGYRTNSTGTGSHAEGGYTTSSNIYSHAEGNQTTASGTATHAEGDQTLASGTDSHAEGILTQATGNYSHAEGYASQATGTSAHAEGRSSVASGLYSHAEGYSSAASGYYSHAEGRGARADSKTHYAQGASPLASAYYSIDGQYSRITRVGLTSNDSSSVNIPDDPTYETEGIIIPENTSWLCKVFVSCRAAAGSDIAAWELSCLVNRNSSDTVYIEGSQTKTVIAKSSGASGFDCSLQVDDTYKCLRVAAVGNSNTMGWVVTFHLYEVKSQEFF